MTEEFLSCCDVVSCAYHWQHCIINCAHSLRVTREQQFFPIPSYLSPPHRQWPHLQPIPLKAVSIPTTFIPLPFLKLSPSRNFQNRNRFKVQFRFTFTLYAGITSQWKRARVTCLWLECWTNLSFDCIGNLSDQKHCTNTSGITVD